MKLLNIMVILFLVCTVVQNEPLLRNARGEEIYDEWSEMVRRREDSEDDLDDTLDFLQKLQKKRKILMVEQ